MSSNDIPNDNNKDFSQNNTSNNNFDKNIEITINLYTGFGKFYTLIAYPFYRKFLENKFFGLQILSNNFYFPKKEEINMSIKNRNGYYAGVSSFFLAHLIQLNYTKLDENSSFIKFYSSIAKFFFKNNETLQELTMNAAFSSVCLFFSYPLFMNSNNKAINSQYYKRLSNPKNLWFIYRNYYQRGSLLFVINGLLTQIPFLNVFVCYKLESIRIAYVYGSDDKGKAFTSYKQARKLITDNDSLQKGKWFYNFMLLPVYYTFFIDLIQAENEIENEEDT